MMISSIIPPTTSTIGNTLTWDYVDLLPGEVRIYTINFSLPTTATPGSFLTSFAEITTLYSDTVPSNNLSQLSQEIVASYDPNDKTVWPDQNFTPDEIADGVWLDYRIRFQNTGNDTAFDIYIEDTLSPLLEINSLEVLTASHGFTWSLSGPGNLKFSFNNILLPDSNVNEPESHGYIFYRIKAKNTLTLGDEIQNTAFIYFDYNSPVVTNTTTNRVELITGFNQHFTAHELGVYPNPTEGKVVLTGNFADAYPLHLEIRNTTGQLVQNQVIQRPGDPTSKLEIDLQDLPNGIYLLHLQGEGYSKAIKTVKME